MKFKLIITVEFDDVSDRDWMVTRCVGPVEDAVAEFIDEGRNDGDVEVSYEVAP